MFSNLKVGARLGLATSVLVLMLVVVGGCALWQLATVNELVGDLLGDKWIKVKLANQIIDSVNANGRQVFGLLQINDKAAMEKMVTEMTVESAKLTKIYESLEKLLQNDAGKAAFKEVLGARKPYIESRKAAIELALAGKAAEATQRFAGETVPLQKKYISAIDSLIDQQSADMDKGQLQSQAIYDRARNILLVFGVFALLVAVVGAYLVTRSITLPLREAVAAANTLASGDLMVKIETKSKDETGQLLVAMQNLVTKLSKS